MTNTMLTNPDYKPENLITLLKEKFNLKSDRKLAELLDIDTAVMSRIKNKKLYMSGEVLLRVHEISGMPIATIRSLCGMPPYILPYANLG